jgi:hypothetical protein
MSEEHTVVITIGPGVVFQDLKRPQRKFRLAVMKVYTTTALMKDNRGMHYTMSLAELRDPALYRVVRA